MPLKLQPPNSGKADSSKNVFGKKIGTEISRTNIQRVGMEKTAESGKCHLNGRMAFGIQPPGGIDAADGGYLLIHKRSKTCQRRCTYDLHISTFSVYFILRTYSGLPDVVVFATTIGENVRWFTYSVFVWRRLETNTLR